MCNHFIYAYMIMQVHCVISIVLISVTQYTLVKVCNVV